MKLAGIARATLLLVGCAKVNVTPLGSTADGRKQFAITCNQQASKDGKCHEKATVACDGDYETQSVSNTGPRPLNYNAQVYADGDRVLLVACNRRTVTVQARALDRL
jgi:hypothetical protein